MKVKIRLLKNAHLLRFPNPSSLRRIPPSTLRMIFLWASGYSGALHLGIFEQPAKNDFFMLTANDPVQLRITKSF